MDHVTGIEQTIASTGLFPPVPIEECPECGGRTLVFAVAGERTNFFCPACASCWHVTLGWTHRVNPETCPGCGFSDDCHARARPYESAP